MIKPTKSKIKIIFLTILSFGIFGLAKSAQAVYPAPHHFQRWFMLLVGVIAKRLRLSAKVFIKFCLKMVLGHVAGRKKFFLAELFFVCLFFLIGLSFTSPAYGAPSVSSINGTVSNGQSITVNGSGFGTKNPVKPYFWADFNSSLNPSSLGRHTAWDNTEYVKYQAGCGPDATGCATDNNAIPGEGPMGLIQTNGDFGAGAINSLSQKTYVYRKVKHNWDIGSYNLKTFRLWPYNAGPGPNNYIQEGNQGSDCEGCDNYCWALNNNWSSNTNWVTQEIQMQANTSLSTTDGILKVYMDSNIWYNCGTGGDGSHSWVMRCTANNYDERDLYFLHAVIANTPTWDGNIHFYYDNVYLDDTWSRVMLCAGSTWANRGHCEIQIPSTWSDNGTSASATVTAEIGTLTGDNYIYVIDSTNTANTDGKKVTIGNGSSDTTPPASPTGLSVN